MTLISLEYILNTENVLYLQISLTILILITHRSQYIRGIKDFVKVLN